MEDRGVDAADLAAGTGIKSNVISDWKTKKTNPRADKISRICEFLGVTCDFLLTGKEQEGVTILSDEEKELITEFKKLDFKGRSAVMSAIVAEQERMTDVKTSDRDTKIG